MTNAQLKKINPKVFLEAANLTVAGKKSSKKLEHNKKGNKP